MRKIALLLLIMHMVLGVASSWGHAQEWTRFRGPNGSGVSPTAVPTEWTPDQLDWKTELPGWGHASPVVWDQMAFVTSGDESSQRLFLSGIELKSGKIRWQRQFPLSRYHIHTRNSYASSTPTVDEQHVYVAWSTPEQTTLAAFDHMGELVWQRTLGDYVSSHGFGASPILWHDSVILTAMQRKPQRDGPRVQRSHIVACDRLTGEIQWDKLLWSDKVSYSAPCIRTLDDNRSEIVMCSLSHGIFAIDPIDGQENWSIDVFDKRTIGSPILVDDLVIGTTGSGGGGIYLVAVKPDPQPTVVYTIRRQAPYVPTPVAKSGRLFLWSDKGIVTCVEAANGQQIWQQRVGGNFSGSPIIAGDHLYCIAEDGVVVVLAAADRYQLVSRNALGEDSRSTPAVANGQLLLRTYRHLMSVGGKG